MSQRPSVYTIPWHENNLNNLISTHKRVKSEIEEKKQKAEELAKRIAFLSLQIQEAKKQEKEKFDSDKFLKDKKNEN